MGRTLWIICLAAVAALVAACGGSSSSSSSSANLGSDDVAVVGQNHITKNDLDHQITLEVAAMKVKQQKVPKVGTSTYTSTVVQPVLAYLVQNAQVHDIAKQLSVVVTPKQIQSQVTKAIQQYYGGDQTKYHADLQKYKLTDQDIADQFELTLLEQKIEAKLRNQVKVTDKDVEDYYQSHQQLYETSADSRTVDYVLLPTKAAAVKAHAALASGKSFADVSTGSIDDSSAHEPFTFSKGGGDKAFQDATFSLKTNQLSGLVPVDKAYTQSSLAGKCQPTCYFIIRPTGDIQKAGAKKSFAEVKDQIRTQLLQSRQQSHIASVVKKLEAQQKKATRYAPGYAPPKTSTPSTGTQQPTS
jgi:foldase protein PrsA